MIYVSVKELKMPPQMLLIATVRTRQHQFTALHPRAVIGNLFLKEEILLYGEESMLHCQACGSIKCMETLMMSQLMSF